MLKYEAPFEYYLIMDSKDVKNFYYEPPADYIEMVAFASKNPVFSKPKFKKYLDEYKTDGLKCGRPKLLTKSRERFYNSMMDSMLFQESKDMIPELKIMGKI